MKVPMKWLNDYVQIDMPTSEYAETMVMSGTGVEGIETTGAEFDKVVVGKIVKIDQHENSDHLLICQIDVGSETIQIVTGAPNVKEGQYIPVALDGATLPGGKIKRGKLRGVESCGMLCSGPELNIPEGLYPHCGDEGILIFNEEYAPGTDVKEVFGLNDDVVDFEILANRPDCLSVWGIARESAAALDAHLVMPEIAVEEKGDKDINAYAKIEVRDDQLCPRYAARVIANVKIGPSPKWMRAYLHAAGVRPINNIVDITNFVMLETGHPMHAFDLSKVKEQTIVVRRAKKGEALTTLDGKIHNLTEDMLVIADAENATGLAGIMGGEESEIVNDTQAVLFECAAFDRTSIRLTSRQLGIRTESSGRFERGVCADTATDALNRACMLVNMLECGDVAPGAVDLYLNPMEKRIVKTSVNRIAERISAELTGEEMQDYLERLFIETDVEGDALTCTIPPYRMDIEGEADLSEEVLRLYGYDHIPSTLMSGETMLGARSDAQKLRDRVTQTLVGMGFYQLQTFSFVSLKWLTALNLPENDARLDPVVLRNPLGEDTSAMRTSLAPSVLNTVSLNVHRGNAAGSVYEMAQVFLKGETGELPQEKKALCLAMYGPDVDFYAVKDAVYCLLDRFGVLPTAQAEGDAYLHPGRKAALWFDGRRIAQIGEVHPDVCANFDMENRRIYLAEVDLDALMDVQREIEPVKTLPKYPAVARDIALVMDERVPVGPVMETIEKAAGKALESVNLFDIYRGAQLGEDKKSVAFAITFRAADRTLTDEEIGGYMEKVLVACKEAYGAEIRG